MLTKENEPKECNENLYNYVKFRNNIISKKLETKIRNRIEFLKNKLFKNILEFNGLVKSLYSNKNTSFSHKSKKNLFSIIKTKNNKENTSSLQENVKNFEEKLNFNSYEEFFISNNISNISDSIENSDNNLNFVEVNNIFCEKFLKPSAHYLPLIEENYEESIINQNNNNQIQAVHNESKLTENKIEENSKEIFFSKDEILKLTNIFYDINQLSSKSLKFDNEG